jgi:hypothetical protein
MSMHAPLLHSRAAFSPRGNFRDANSPTEIGRNPIVAKYQRSQVNHHDAPDVIPVSALLSAIGSVRSDTPLQDH